ncbi:amino acid adenylation domain-containing protein [Saccharothrix deserti]|uniref:amino acid adenylation domain-containing protein n=1 Tax=Saccharothrix deserti TaxID=2593674 RepID=UPI00131BE83A|nr:amino acid adenylation domain-containing protein [Saccharothrix deserti]
MRSAVHPHGVRTDSPITSTVPRLIAQVALARPDAVALSFPEEVVTYRELCLRAGRLAERLAELGVSRGDVVGVLDHQSARQVVTLLAVLQAGAAYLPLDPATPPARQRVIVDQAGAVLVLTAGDLAADPGWVDLDELTARALRAPGCAEATWRYPEGNGEDLAYVMYTSGSTGRPKGVMAPHRAIIHLVVDTDYLRLGSDDVVAFASNIAFDAVTFEIWGPLLNGAVVQGLDRDSLLSTYSLGNSLAEHRVTAMFMTTALFHLHARLAPAGFATLRRLMVGGEVMNPEAALAVLAAGPPRWLVNIYGPTEATTFSTAHRIRSLPRDATSVPIGRPIANASTWVLDEDLRPVPPRVTGELFIGGPGLAHGYRGQPDLTAAKFVPDPNGTDTRLYRTGDYVRWTDDHLLDFVGRRDEQIKVRGFRIETPEVEAALAALPAVREAVVAVHGRGEARSLVAFVVPSSPGAAAGAARDLAVVLPPQMIPAPIVEVPRFPLTANGKVDRAALLSAVDEIRPDAVAR